MRVQVRKGKAFGEIRVDAHAKIENVVVHEDLVDQEKRHVAIYFKGQDSTGILRFGQEEFQELIDSLKAKGKLVKKSKVIRG